MFTSADFIEALRRRGRKSLRPETPPGELPPGWQDWFDAMVARLGAVTGAAADAFVALFLERELAMPPPRTGALSRWQAFATLWRQQWHPPAPEERRERVLAMAITLAVHLVLLVLLLWIALVRFTGAPAPRGEEVVQVEYIGQGTPQDTGGAPAPGEKTAQPAAASARSAPREPSARPSAAPIRAAPAPQPPSATQEPAAPATPSQPLAVSEVPRPEGFVLPPPTPPLVELPRLPAPELQVVPREVEAIERAGPIEAPRAQVPDVALTAPALHPDVAQSLPDVQAQRVEMPRLRAPELQAQQREIRLREPQPSSSESAAPPSQASASSSAPSATQSPATAAAAPSTSPPAGRPAASSGTAPSAAATSGAGPAASKPGAWPSPVPNDDWGNSTRNRPGGAAGQPGLAGADGRPRLPPGMAAPGGGLPPGTVTEKIDNLDRAGTWLKRPPVDYSPTRFDRFWVPSETLLEEWVRKNIRSVDIPIPGSSKKLHCVVSLLQLGGGCGIDDPDLQDQEVEARKPPDVPFKSDLQEDQGSLGKPR